MLMAVRDYAIMEISYDILGHLVAPVIDADKGTKKPEIERNV
jgi:hypothetical protein